LLHKELVLGAFDPEGARALGYSRGLDLLLLLLIEAVVVTTVPAVGTILSVALLAVPALTARLWADRIGTTMALAALIGAGSGIIGLVASTQFQIAAGAAIAFTAAALFGLSWLLAPRRGLLARVALPRSAT
jgi:ABC-type Mn2+/Zn2+ transport system permease subunit